MVCRFPDLDHSLGDAARSGSPCSTGTEENTNLVRTSSRSDPRISVREIADCLIVWRSITDRSIGPAICSFATSAQSGCLTISPTTKRTISEKRTRAPGGLHVQRAILHGHNTSRGHSRLVFHQLYARTGDLC